MAVVFESICLEAGEGCMQQVWLLGWAVVRLEPSFGESASTKGLSVSTYLVGM